jgi:glycosyltransferase involved in cell wall biosynthesis
LHHFDAQLAFKRGTLPMRIAQIAPLCERVPPQLYGGTERIVYYLTEELVRQGHDVTLFASGDSKTSAKLVPCCEMALRLNPSVKDLLPYHIIMLEAVRQRIDQFDVLHFHIDILQAPLVRGFARSRSLLSDVWRAAARLREGWGAPRNPPSLTMVL